MIKSDEKKIVAGGLIAVGFVFVVIAALTDCSAGGADNYAHFNIARWAFRYPYLFLDHWGKPLFTILIAPFTQLGFFGARLFNLLAGLLTAWICYLLASRLQLRKAWLVTVFVVFAPMYFILMFSGMTEILFSLVLMLAIWLYFNERFILSAVAVSFIILVRSEGFVFLPVFLTAYLLKKKFTAIPFLATGFLVFSLIGLLYHYHNFWWLIEKLPYVGGLGGIYGSGPWYHFLLKMPDYLGYLLIVLFVAGLVIRLKNWSAIRYRMNSGLFDQLLILAGCFAAYLVSHSYVWWRGEMSLGLIRVMAGVTPIAAVFALIGWNSIEKMIRPEKLKPVFLLLTLLLVVIPGVSKYSSEFASNPQNKLIDKVVSWLRETGNFKHHLIIHDPYIAFSARVDAWDQQVVQYGFSDISQPELAMPDSSIFIWDAHFSQNEGRVAASGILENPFFELIGYFEPEVPFKVLNGYDYCIMVFRKVNRRTTDNLKVLNELKENVNKGNLVYSELLDFEVSNPEKVPDQFRVAATDRIPNFVYQMAGNEFSPSVLLSGKQVEMTNRLSVQVSFDFYPEDQFKKDETLLIFSVEKDDQPYYYKGNDILPFVLHEGQWNHASFRFSMPEEVKKDTRIKLYIWNIQKKNFKMDNFKVQAFAK